MTMILFLPSTIEPRLDDCCATNQIETNFLSSKQGTRPISLECPITAPSEIIWHGPPDFNTVIAQNGGINGQLKNFYGIVVDSLMKQTLQLKDISKIPEGVIRCLNGSDEYCFCICKNNMTIPMRSTAAPDTDDVQHLSFVSFSTVYLNQTTTTITDEVFPYKQHTNYIILALGFMLAVSLFMVFVALVLRRKWHDGHFQEHGRRDEPAIEGYSTIDRRRRIILSQMVTYNRESILIGQNSNVANEPTEVIQQDSNTDNVRKKNMHLNYIEVDFNSQHEFDVRQSTWMQIRSPANNTKQMNDNETIIIEIDHNLKGEALPEDDSVGDFP